MHGAILDDDEFARARAGSWDQRSRVRQTGAIDRPVDRWLGSSQSTTTRA